jgi:hypothetical protein
LRPNERIVAVFARHFQNSQPRSRRQIAGPIPCLVSKSKIRKGQRGMTPSLLCLLMQAGGPAHPRSDILQGIIGCLCGIEIGRVVWKSIAGNQLLAKFQL